MSKKLKKVCTTLNYIEQLFILASKIIGCISISSFASLLGIPIVWSEEKLQKVKVQKL